jgi:uncharacterized delta-60 repeat protein
MKRAATLQNVRQTSISALLAGLAGERCCRFGLFGRTDRFTAFTWDIPSSVCLFWLLFVCAPSALAAPGDVDLGFNATANGAYYIYGTAVKTDGKIVIGGQFFNEGQVVNGIVRSEPGRTPDIGFNPDVRNTVYCIAVQADGKIVIPGYLGIARLNADGTLDTSFSPDANDSFFNIDGIARNHVARLNADGTLDPGFNFKNAG